MRILKYIFSLILLSVLTVSCTDDDYTKVDLAQSEPVISSPNSGQNFILLKENADLEATNITWSAASLNVNTPVVYLVEIALSGTDFAMPVNITNTTETSHSIKVSQFNSKVIEAGLLPETPGSVDLRIRARLGDANGYFISSEIITLNVTPYTDVLDLSTEWGIVGSATPNGWDGPDVPFYKQQGAENANILVAYATLIDGEIKFRMNNSWDAPNINYGGSGGTLVEGGDNIPVTSGSYKIIMNLNDLTYSLEEFSLGIVGDAAPNGWDGPDAQLLYDPTSDQFRAVVELSDGEIKFRMNNAWDTNYGGSGGVLEAGGGNIAVSAGKYVVTVNLNELTYELEPIENIWGLVGSATPNGWDGPDIQLNIDYTSEYTAGGTWYINNLPLAAGAVKFRADNDWGLNYGGAGLEGNLENGGGDIIITTAGNYNVTMNLSDMTYSFEIVE